MKTSKRITTLFLCLMTLIVYSCQDKQLDFSQEQIPYGSNDGEYVIIRNTRVYYEEYGEGMPLILLHGAGTPMRNFKNVIPELSDHFKVIAIDSPGWGRSEHPDSLSYQLLADYYSEIIDMLDLDSVYVFGYSMGGNTTLLLARDRPDKVKRIVVSSAVSDIDGIEQRLIDHFESWDPEYLQANDPDFVLEYKKKLLNPIDWKISLIDRRNLLLTREVISDSDLGRIQCKSLILYGDRDVLLKLEHGISIYRNIKESELCILPDTPHRTIMAKPDLVNKIVIEFLQKE